MSAPLKETEITPTARTNLIILIVLMGLLVVTVLLSLVNLHGWGTAAALTIASAKALLVLAYFMHLRYGNRLSILFAGAGFVWLGIMIAYLMTEAITG